MPEASTRVGPLVVVRLVAGGGEVEGGVQAAIVTAARAAKSRAVLRNGIS